MRVAAILSAFMVLASGAAPAATLQTASPASANAASHCPGITRYLADRAGLYQGTPLKPKKLNQLPPATTYMAVYRHIGPCEAPLTMAEYRSLRPR
jgi:hypothetical protein